VRPNSALVKSNVVKGHGGFPKNLVQGLPLTIQQSALARFSNASGTPRRHMLPMPLDASATSSMAVATIPRVNLRPPTACTRLSRECQRHGFNPLFRYRSVKTLDGVSKYVVDVEINGVNILGDPYDDEITAKRAVASKGLHYMRGKYPSGMGMNRQKSRDMAGNPLPYDVPQISGPLLRPPLGPPAAPLGITHTSNDSLRKRNDVPLQRSSPSDPPIMTVSNVNLPGNIEAAEVDAVLKEELRKEAATNMHFYLPANVSVAVARAYGEAIGNISRSQQQHFGLHSSEVRQYSPQFRGRAGATAPRLIPREEFGCVHGRSSDREDSWNTYRGAYNARRFSRSRSPRRERIPDDRDYSYRDRGREYGRENPRDLAHDHARGRF
jgi:hypothetical protein